jgi:hypothetical protein
MCLVRRKAKAVPAVAKRDGTRLFNVNFENLTSKNTDSEHSDRLNFILPDQATPQGQEWPSGPTPSSVGHIPTEKTQSDHSKARFMLWATNVGLKTSCKSGTYFIFPGICVTCHS